MIVWLARVITENRAGFSSSAAADFVSVIAPGSWTDVIYTQTLDHWFITTYSTVLLLTVLVNWHSSMKNVERISEQAQVQVRLDPVSVI